MNLAQLKTTLAGGLLSFPVTPFTPGGETVDVAAFADHVSWLAGYPATGFFVAGGTGEFFSLTPREVVELVRCAKGVAGGKPVIAGCGYGTAMAVELAREVERAGADGLLLLPHYLIGAEQEGQYQRVKAVCDAVGIGVIVYNRDNAVLQPETVARLCEACPNLIGFKDGHGDIEILARVCAMLGDRLIYVGGMPTAELYAAAYRAVGVSTYSSAVFNFIPEQALAFYRAVMGDETAAMNKMLKEFFFPYLAIRNRRKGYAVSIIKAGLRLIGRDPGPVRPPLVELTVEESGELEGLLVRAFGPGFTQAAA